MSRPPCWPEGQPCPNWCADERYQRTVYNRHYLPVPWQGWRFAGRDLITPEGVRISPERFKGLAWRVEAEARRDARPSPSTATARNSCRTAQPQSRPGA